jgi:hypothetical protein
MTCSSSSAYRRARAATALALLPAMLIAAVAAHAAKRPIDASKLWATVNVCDTTTHPNTIGLRASMPGTGNSADEMFMRFQVQYFTVKDGRWHKIGSGGDSGFVDVGPGRQKVREAGRSFVLAPIVGASTGYQLRGLVTFEWRRSGVPTQRLRRLTTAKHISSAGADPPAFSAALCGLDGSA